jgi:hypothetical protein
MHRRTVKTPAYIACLRLTWLWLLPGMLPSTPACAFEPLPESALKLPAAPHKVLRYPRSFSGYEDHDNYVLALLQLPLDKAGSPLTLTPSTHSMGQDRAG